MTLETGSLLHDRYKILQVLTHGGMGAIYRADDQRLNVEVAVKENLISTEDFSRQFHREANILASLRHPNLPRVTDHFIIPDQGQYLVMDFIEGEDLRQRIQRQGILPEDEVLAIGVTISEALSYLHNRQPQILHRDIKPGNIKITPAGQIFLVDFGLAKVLQAGHATTIGAQALTPGFAPPEQYGQGTDPRSDIYALGATLYNALTNQTPEDGLARALNTNQLTSIRKHNPAVNKATAAAIEKAMAVSPENRFQSAEDFKQALLNASTTIRRRANLGEILVAPAPAPAMAAQPVQGAAAATRRVSRPLTTPRQPAKKNKWLLWLLAGVVGVTALIAVVFIGGGIIRSLTAQRPTPTLSAALPSKTASPATRTPRPTLAPSATHTLAPSVTLELTLTLTLEPFATATIAPSDTPSVIMTPIGGGMGQIAFVSNRGGNGTYQIWLMDSDGNNQQQLTDFKEGACQPAWSPDGLRLVVISPCEGRKVGPLSYRGASLYIFDLATKAKTPISTSSQGDFDPTWSPDGKYIAFTSLRENLRMAQIYLYSLDDQSTRKLSPDIYASDWQPTWSPDSTEVVYVSNKGDQSMIWRYKIDGSSKATAFTRYEWKDIVFMPDWAPDNSMIIYCQTEFIPVLFGQLVTDRMTQFRINDKFAPVWDADFSPDSQWIAFQGVQEEANSDIFVFTRLGSDLRRLTTDKFYDIQPVWRPATPSQ